MKTKLFSIISIILVSSILSACGGSSSSSSSDSRLGPATIGEDNKQDLATAASLAAAEVKNTNDGSDNIPFAAELILSPNISKSNEVTRKIATANSLPSAAESDLDSFCDTGSVDVSGNESNTTIKYNKCAFDGVVFSGKAKVKISGNKTTIIYEDFTISQNGETEVLNATITCTDEVCSISSDFKDESGKSYTVSNSSIAGNDSTGYTISADVLDSEHGEISFEASNIKFNCSNGYPSSGVIIFTDGTTEARINFNNCDDYTLTIDGNAEVFDW